MVRYIEYASTTESMHLFDTKYFHTEDKHKNISLSEHLFYNFENLCNQGVCENECV